jgi:ribosomal protein S2
MALPDFSMRQLLEAGVHFGHQTHRWNPKMAPYIFGVRNNIHIIDLSQSVPLLHQALKLVSDTVAKGGRVLFVGTKRQASEIVADAAQRSAQYYVNARWLGGMLTNWKTISNSISRLRKLDEMLASGEAQAYTKKERLTLQRERDKLDRSLGGTTLLLAALPWIPPAAKPPIAEIHLENCSACGFCAEDCPYGAIDMVPREDGGRVTLQAQVDPTLCVGCGICVGACPASSPLRRMENVFLSPHIAGGSEQARANLLEQTAANVRRALGGEKPVNVVNGL